MDVLRAHARAISVAVLVLATADSSRGQDLLVNGDFELEAVPATPEDCCEVLRSLDAGGELPGWTVGGGGAELRGRRGECLDGPAEGLRWIRLGRGTAPGWISQTVSTQPGVRYQVRFRRWVEAPTSATVALRVTGPGFNIMLLLPTDGTTCSVETAAITACEFDAPSTSSTIRIETFGGPADRHVLLDEVRLISASDCDGSGQPDAIEILEGILADRDGDGLPDACECLGDVDGDGVIGGADLGAILSAWGTGDDPADLDSDGFVAGGDLAIVLGGWGGCG